MTAVANRGLGLAETSPRPAPAQPATQIVEPDPEPAAEPEIVLTPEPETKTAPVPKVKATTRTKADDAATLEARAQAAWAAGDLALAERLLRKVIKTTSSRSRREQAYGDLLSLLELRGDQTRTRKLWRTYLRKYPRGRYADDLQARICRSEATSACWSDYLKKHPKGAHRREAESATRP